MIWIIGLISYFYTSTNEKPYPGSDRGKVFEGGYDF